MDGVVGPARGSDVTASSDGRDGQLVRWIGEKRSQGQAWRLMGFELEAPYVFLV